MLDIKRREFIALLGGAVAWPYVAAAQGAKKRPVIGMLGQGTPAQLKGVQLRQYFLNGMRELGYVEGRRHHRPTCRIHQRLAKSGEGLGSA